MTLTRSSPQTDPLPDDTNASSPEAVAVAAPAGAGRSGGGWPRTYGHSKDFREDLPQVVIGMAVIRTGIPDPDLVLAGQHR